jgi:hypothetical protein
MEVVHPYYKCSTIAHVEYFVLVAWAIQAAVGLWMLVGWARHSRAHAGSIIMHVALMLLALALWIAFIITDAVAFAWANVLVYCVGIPFGDSFMRRRGRRLRGGEKRPVGVEYWHFIVDVFRGGVPASVRFHGVFSGVVFFSSVGVSIGATIAG